MKNNASKTRSSILQDGKIKPGIYKIQNIVSKTYVDIKDHVRELCGRPSSTLEKYRGRWEIQPLGSGYTIRKAGPAASGKPDQFCIMLNGIGNEHAISVSDFPVAWKIAVVHDAKYSGFEYVRIFWGSTNMVWDLAQWGSERDGTKIQVMDNGKPEPCRIWELVPVKVDNFPAQPSSSGSQRDFNPVPPYEENPGNHCCTCSHVTTEPDDGGYGTTIIEVTTVTTRRKFRLED
ncbi:hypothetical protein BDM02DRAFT_1746722 [Thelephora ganbajun]|uniref:Uncharacterized protein n=1 Tax=Thelephora ganbajun TaxID=370292 RepID=A0ACB6ZJA6_THEGA|nr:hypothetical protein BDM02DRAFT_1746722 [Thelephora ganbajun]